jgi:hypothetical protein
MPRGIETFRLKDQSSQMPSLQLPGTILAAYLKSTLVSFSCYLAKIELQRRRFFQVVSSRKTELYRNHIRSVHPEFKDEVEEHLTKMKNWKDDLAIRAKIQVKTQNMFQGFQFNFSTNFQIKFILLLFRHEFDRITFCFNLVYCVF